MKDGYVDLQVNGYAGVDFNADDLDADAFTAACQALSRDGVAGFFPTIITDHMDRMIARIKAVATFSQRDPLTQQMVRGIHVEGPFLSARDGYRGAHPLDAICEASISLTDQIIDAADGMLSIFTLAPEMDPGATVTRHLTQRGVVVSAGHTDASMDQLSRAIDAGLTLFTHLGNGCPMRGMDRHDNIVQRVLALAKRGCIVPTFIADGVHVPFFALKNYLDLIGVDRAVIVTDAMAAAGLGAGRHRLGRWLVDVGDDLAAWAPDRSHLVGSAMSMNRAATNLAAIGLESGLPALLRDNAIRVCTGFISSGHPMR